MFTENKRISFDPLYFMMTILELDKDYVKAQGYSEEEIKLLNDCSFFEETVFLPTIKNEVQTTDLVELDSFLSGMYDAYWGSIYLIENDLQFAPFIIVGTRKITIESCRNQMKLCQSIIQRYSPEKYKEIFV